jgi:ABC-2 type transport system ATP-binding protein
LSNLTRRKAKFIGLSGQTARQVATIRTLLSLIYKTSGEARIFGLDCETDKVKILGDVGYLPSEVFYYDNMRAVDLFRYSASFYKKDCTQKIEELASLLQLDLKKKIEDMSLGTRKRWASSRAFCIRRASSSSMSRQAAWTP